MSSRISRGIAAWATIVICGIVSNAGGATVEKARTGFSSTAARPALFELNTGQFASDIAYRASFPQVNAAIHTDGSFSAYPRPGSVPGLAPVRFELQQANTNIAARAEQPHAYCTNYLYGGDAPKQFRDVPHFQRVQFDEVYPYIALAYYPAGGKLEYDFIVKPQGDVGKISWKVSGAKSLSINKEGDLVIATASGDYLQKRPLAYQSIDAQRRQVAVAYRLGPTGSVGFAVGDYDKNNKLVIDPVIEYASYLGGAGDDNPLP